MTINHITVDGPSGCGKGTLSMRLAKYMGWHFLDSGAIYRVLSLAAVQNSIALDNIKALENLALCLDVDFVSDEQTGDLVIKLDSKEVTGLLRTEDCGAKASIIAVYPEVRQALLARQRAFLRAPGLVADGRDMGTVVFPEAQLKLFLEATPEIRAQRRYHQLQQMGKNVSISDLFTEITARDARDRARVVAPLVPAKDAIVIDTSYLDINEVFEQVLAYVKVNFKFN